MTLKTTTMTAARQAMTSNSRATMREIDDKHLMCQIKGGDIHHSESHTDFERFQPVGMTGHPLKQDEEQQQQGGGSSGGSSGSGGGGGGDGYGPRNNNQPKGPASEACMVYMNGDRSHPIAVNVDDRRVRPYDIQEGEGSHYSCDGSGQMMLHRQEAVYVLTRDGKSYRKNSDQQKRFSSLRHVTKDYQERKVDGGGQPGSGSTALGLAGFKPKAGNGSGGGSSQKKADHVGKLNTGINCFVDKIEFRKKNSGSQWDRDLAAREENRHPEVRLQDPDEEVEPRDDSPDKEGVLHGLWDSIKQNWWWNAAKDFQVQCGANTFFQAMQHLRIGDHLVQGNTFTSGVEHAADHVAGGGASISPGDKSGGSGIPGAISLIAVDGRVTALEQAPPPSVLSRLAAAITFDASGRMVINNDVTIAGDVTVIGDLEVRGVIHARNLDMGE